MPKFRVETNQGTFVIETDRPPTSAQELNAVIQQQLKAGTAAPFKPTVTAGTPLQEAQGLLRSEGLAPSPEQPIREFGKRAALPVAAVGAASLLGPLAGLGTLGTIGLESAASLGARQANIGLGLEEASLTQDILAVGAPGAGRAIGGAIKAGARFGARRLPGAAPVLQEEAISIARTIPNRVAPAQAADKLFSLLAQTNPAIRINTPNLRSVASKLLQQEQQLGQVSGSLKSGTIGAAAGDLAAAQALSPEQLRLLLRRLGQRTGAVQGLEATESRDAFKALFGALQKDLDEAIAAGGQLGKAAGLLRAARDAVRREKSILDLTDVIESGIRKTRGDFLEEINPKKILNAFDSKQFRVAREVFNVKEQAEIRSILKGMKGIPKLPPEAGVQAGSFRKLGALALGGSAGFAVGGQEGIVAGVAAVEIISRSLSTAPGRALLRRLLQPSGFLDSRAFSILAAYVRSQSDFGVESPAPQPGLGQVP